MSVNQALIDEFTKLSIDELKETGLPGTCENHLCVLTTWCEVYDDVPPRNRAETAVRDALEHLRERLAQRHARSLQSL